MIVICVKAIIYLLSYNLRHCTFNDGVERDEETTPNNYFLLPVSVCATAANNKLTDTVWFVQIIGELDSPENVIDDYGHAALAGEKYMLGLFFRASS